MTKDTDHAIHLDIPQNNGYFSVRKRIVEMSGVGDHSSHSTMPMVIKLNILD